jgi:hypothetical protein
MERMLGRGFGGGLLAGCLGLALFWGSGCENMKPLGAPSGYGAARIKPEAMREFLAENELNTPTILTASLGHLAKGKLFRERLRDQRGRRTLATIWIDADEPDMLHIRTMREDTCPKCGGTGVRETSLNIKVTLMCPRCEGTGVVEDFVQEKKYILSAADLVGGAAALPAQPARTPGRTADPSVAERALSPTERAYVSRVASSQASERVEALRWLDAHYVAKEAFFSRLMPLLRKATWIETSPDGSVTVYQFRAGREEIPAWAYYRIWVDKKKGTVLKKRFVSLAEARGEADPSAAESAEDTLKETTDSVYRWFTDGWDEGGL